MHISQYHSAEPGPSVGYITTSNLTACSYAED